MMAPSMRPQDWASCAAAGATVVFVAALLGGHAALAGGAGIAGLSSVVAARVWSRKYPGPMASALRWVLPLFPHATRSLKKILSPRSGERILEIGPGVGNHALAMAPLLHPAGSLAVLDIQQEMLDALVWRAAANATENIIRPTRADAQNLPYRDATFDGAYVSAVLGEIPDQKKALRELRRVLKPDGRLVVGEVVLDPDYVSLSHLRQEAASAGLVFETMVGLELAYFARFRPTQS